MPYTEQLEQPDAPKTEDALKNSLRFYSPLVKNIAAQEGISGDELEKIPGTGAEGRLTKDDLLNYIQNRYQSASDTQNDVSVVNEDAGRGSFGPSQAVSSGTSENEPVVDTPPDEPAPEIAGPEQVAETPQPEPVFEALAAEPVSETSKTN